MIRGEKNDNKGGCSPETCGSAAEVQVENLDCGVPAMYSAVCGTLHIKMEEQGNVWAHSVLALVLTASWVSVCQGRTKRSRQQFLPTWSLHLEPLCEVGAVICT